MELLQMKYFREAVISMNFSHTAEKFRVPQSAVSQSIKRLEDELGTPLFSRSANRITPNECGKMLYNHISVALSEIEKGIDAIKLYSADVSGNLCIKIENNRKFFTDCIADFKKLYPAVDFTIYHQNPSHESLTFDFIASAEEIKDMTYKKQVVLTEKIALAVSRRHELAREKSIKLDMIKNVPFISMPRGHNLYEILRSIFQTMEIRPNITISCDDPYYVRKYTELGLGVSLFPQISWSSYISKDIAIIPFEDISPERSVCLYSKKHTDNTDVAARFKEFVVMKSNQK